MKLPEGFKGFHRGGEMRKRNQIAKVESRNGDSVCVYIGWQGKRKGREMLMLMLQIPFSYIRKERQVERGFVFYNLINIFLKKG